MHALGVVRKDHIQDKGGQEQPGSARGSIQFTALLHAMQIFVEIWGVWLQKNMKKTITKNSCYD